jgi:coenzyme F420-0:L-glutamate ligase/coenzyme F420-1:gamma-L-glutamate ligase
MSGRIEILPIEGIAEIGAGDPLGTLIAKAARSGGLDLAEDDIVCVAQKVVSKAEGRARDLADVEPGEGALDLAARLDKDARMVQAILDESREVIRAERGVLIVETVSGWICANAGVDASNVPGEDHVTLLPEDADASARRLRDELAAVSGTRPAVVIADSFGRPWRLGQADVAIGCAGLNPLDDRRGDSDRQGRELTATVTAIADEVAASADLARDKKDGVPAVLVRGLGRYVGAEDGPGAVALRRAEAEDLFR